MKKQVFNKFLRPLCAVLIVSGACLVSCGDDEDSPVNNTAPIASFSVQSEGIVGEEIRFSDNSSDTDGSIVSWEWDFGDGSISNEQNPVYTYNAANAYTVSLTVTDDGGLTNSSSNTISIAEGENHEGENQAPTSSFTVQSEGTVGEGIQFTDNSSDADGTIVSWEWDFGDGYNLSEQNPVYTYFVAGTYEVTLVITDDGGLSSTSTNSIVIAGSNPIETGTFDRTFSHNSITREYLLHLPTSYNREDEVPLVVYLHGAGENKEFAPLTTDLVEVAEAEGFVLVFAEASFELQGQGVFVWADGRGAIDGVVDNSIDDVSFVNALVDAISDEFAINPSKRYLCGFSNGGSLTQRMAIQANERFAAMATVAAGLHEPYATENPGRAIPMLFIHGTDDPLASYEEGGITGENQLMFTVGLLNVEESVGYWVTNNQCDATPVETDLANSNTEDNSTITKFEYTGGTNGAAVTLYRINGGGHTWPGVENGALRQPQIFGQTNEDVKAGREIWDFFNKFELN